MRAVATLLALTTLLAACQAAPTAVPQATPSPSREPLTPSPERSPEPRRAEREFPGPHAPTPDSPKQLAAAVRSVYPALRRAIDRWLEAGAPVTLEAIPKAMRETEETVALGALWQQRLIKAVSRDPGLERKVLRRLPARVRRVVAAHTQVGRGLRTLVTPLKPPIRMRITPPHDPELLLRVYRRAGPRFGIHWSILASLNFVESKFGRFMGPSSAGAMGPMQFIPSTWDAYGGGGDVWEPRDAIPAAARYLAASGAPSDMRGALFAYNRSYEYVDAILAYADRMRAEPRAFYEYFYWQVFVATTRGDLQLTGIGARRRP